MKTAITILVSLMTLTTLAQNAEAKTFKPILDDQSKLLFSVGYTAGTHRGFAKTLEGAVITNDAFIPSAIKLSLPLESMTTGNANRDCHMREALGIQYAGSKFPAEHVCDSNNKTPSSGPDSVVYPTVDFEFSQFEQLPTELLVDTAVQTLLQANISLHGVTASYKIPVEITLQADQTLRVKGKFNVSLKDHAIVVKPFKIVFVSITVDDLVSLDFNLLFKPIP